METEPELGRVPQAEPGSRASTEPVASPVSALPGFDPSRSPAFTPGPWFTGRLIRDEFDQFGTISVGPYPVADKPNLAHYESTICDVWDNPNNAGDPLATAALIAAAPQLYAALEYARDLLGVQGIAADEIDNALKLAREPLPA